MKLSELKQYIRKEIKILLKEDAIGLTLPDGMTINGDPNGNKLTNLHIYKNKERLRRTDLDEIIKNFVTEKMNTDYLFTAKTDLKGHPEITKGTHVKVLGISPDGWISFVHKSDNTEIKLTHREFIKNFK